MYGLVNKALQELLVERYDEATWERVLDASGIDEEGFIGMDPYPDDQTYALLDTAACELGLEPAELLEVFGEFWVLYTAREGYGELIDMAGRDLDAFLGNLDRIHDRIQLAFPDMRPPAFTCRRAEEGDGWDLEYRSPRPGLAPMVTGVLRGLGRRFGESLSIDHRPPACSGEADAFRIRRTAA